MKDADDFSIKPLVCCQRKKKANSIQSSKILSYVLVVLAFWTTVVCPFWTTLYLNVYYWKCIDINWGPTDVINRCYILFWVYLYDISLTTCEFYRMWDQPIVREKAYINPEQYIIFSLIEFCISVFATHYVWWMILK